MFLDIANPNLGKYENIPVFRVITPPAMMPVSLIDAKTHMRLAGDDQITSIQLLAPNTYNINSAINCAAADLSSYQGTLILDCGTCSGNLTIVINHRNDPSEDWQPWVDSNNNPITFPAVGSTNNNQSFSLLYTGNKRYVMPVATITNDVCSFGISIELQAPTSAEDNWIIYTLNALCNAAQRKQNRYFMEQTVEMVLNDWPYEIVGSGDVGLYNRGCTYPGAFNYGNNYPIVNQKKVLEIPRSPIQSITFINYIDNLGNNYTFDPNNYYFEPDRFNPSIVLNHEVEWPDVELRRLDAITIRMVAGYASPDEFKANEDFTYQWLLAALYRMHEDRSLTIAEIDSTALMFDTRKFPI